ncbi:uncharacterized protein LOC114301651 isoform X2 [Camellia sinensis]|uniref:uncharacterized protein LOC114301651 isoform X2 n=1 Tax=Camellia sinensis TaxID=4442 RepID=UPI001036708B|nr:uncharacterized protein LOC114301651 isoform X2 [Camellia sinensis]
MAFIKHIKLTISIYIQGREDDIERMWENMFFGFFWVPIAPPFKGFSLSLSLSLALSHRGWRAICRMGIGKSARQGRIDAYAAVKVVPIEGCR